MKVQMGLDNVSYRSKPQNGYEIDKIKQRAMKNWCEIDIEQAADWIGNGGHAFLQGKLIGGKRAENCEGMQVFGLDFDNGICFEDIQQRCKRLQIPISFAYHTYNSSEVQERFRIVLICDIYVNDIYIVKIIRAMLEKIFPECDKSCKNLDRVFLGGKELIYVDGNAHIALVQLLHSFYVWIDKEGNYKRKLLSFCTKNRILMINNRAVMGTVNLLDNLDKNDEFWDSAIIHKIGNTQESSFFIVESKKEMHQRNIRIPKKVKKVDVSGESGCRLLDKFLQGDRLEHNQRFAILTNMLWIKGGKQKFVDTLEQYYENETAQKWQADIKYMFQYKPMRCADSFCPYYGICNQYGTILETISTNRKVVKLYDEIYYPLEEGVVCVSDALEQAYRTYGSGIHLIKAQTAIGKTTQYINLIKKHIEERKFLIALPTNILKQQVNADLLKAGIDKDDVFVTASMGEEPLLYEEAELIQGNHEQGLHNEKMKILKEVYEEIKDDPFQKIKLEACERILKGLDELKNQRIIVTTHAYLMQMSEEFLSEYTIIVDEDILQLQVFNQFYSVSENCLNRIIEQGVPGYSEIARKMLDAKENEYKKIELSCELPELEWEQMEQLEACTSDNINDMQYAGASVKMRLQSSGERVIKYFCPAVFYPLKYIVLSATLNVDIYRKYFAGKLHVYSYKEKKVAYKGQLVQYTYHSLGRRDLSKKMQVFDFARMISHNPKLEIITFKEGRVISGVRDMNSKNLHFGNTTGINALAGRDMAIVGTPYKVEETYKLIACYLGADVNNEIDDKPRPRRVEYKNYSFYITSYSDKLLRTVQLYALESELEQCVGRARLLRKNCNVYVFSAFPCEQAEIRMGDYLSLITQ